MKKFQIKIRCLPLKLCSLFVTQWSMLTFYAALADEGKKKFCWLCVDQLGGSEWYLLHRMYLRRYKIRVSTHHFRFKEEPTYVKKIFFKIHHTTLTQNQPKSAFSQVITPRHIDQCNCCWHFMLYLKFFQGLQRRIYIFFHFIFY